MVRELGSVCGSTAMVVTMHYAAVAALTAAGDKETLTAIAARHAPVDAGVLRDRVAVSLLGAAVQRRAA